VLMGWSSTEFPEWGLRAPMGCLIDLECAQL
jgi:hypothetical protein